MTIALLTDGIPPYVQGGMQKHSFLLVEYLAKNGVEVLLYHCVDPDAKVSEDEVKTHFSEDARSQILVRTFAYRDNGFMPGHYVRSQKELSSRYYHRLKSEDKSIDFIYSKGFAGWATLRHRSSFPNCPIGVKFHGMNMFQVQPDWKGELSKFLLRAPVRGIMQEADYVFSYGGKISEIIRQEVKGRSEVVEIPAGIYADSIRKDQPMGRKDNTTRFIFVGRYDRLKGLPELYAVLRSLSRNDWRFTFVGPIPEDDRLEHPNCIYTGPIYDQRKLFEILDQSDVLVCPSISEGMPNVILEAMARGVAVIATDVGATSILVGENGRLIQAKDSQALESALCHLMEMEDNKLIEMKQAGIAIIRKDFTWEMIVRKLLEFLKGV